MSRLNQDTKMISIMEDDLKSKITVMINTNPDMNMRVHGVFSIDELEQKMESDLGGAIAVGVQYAGVSRVAPATGNGNPARGNSATNILISFSVILGVPTNDAGDERVPATELLTMLRFSIDGKPIGTERAQRTWEFILERPEVSASSNTMLYYAQVWQVAMQNCGSAAPAF